jgi:hypothetical protein
MRPDIATALDAPELALDEDERKFVQNIRQHGWFRTQIFPESDYPEFSFTTGFWVGHVPGGHRILDAIRDCT